MTIEQICSTLPKLKTKPAQKPAPAVTTVRPADVTAQEFAQRIRILADEALADPDKVNPALELIESLASEMAETPVKSNGHSDPFQDHGLRPNAERIVRALKLSDVTPGQIVSMVETYEAQEAEA